MKDFDFSATGLLGLILTVALFAFRFIREWRSAKSKAAFYEAQASVSRLMRRCCATTDIDRFLIFRKNHTVSVMDEQHSDIAKSVFESYQNIDVDNIYHDMVDKAKEDGFVDIVTEDMEDCLLKSYYEEEGVKFSRVYYIHDIDGLIYYCSVASYSVNFLDDPASVITIDGIVEMIRRNYRLYYK